MAQFKLVQKENIFLKHFLQTKPSLFLRNYAKNLLKVKVTTKLTVKGKGVSL